MLFFIDSAMKFCLKSFQPSSLLQVGLTRYYMIFNTIYVQQ